MRTEGWLTTKFCLQAFRFFRTEVVFLMLLFVCLLLFVINVSAVALLLRSQAHSLYLQCLAKLYWINSHKCKQ